MDRSSVAASVTVNVRCGKSTFNQYYKSLCNVIKAHNVDVLPLIIENFAQLGLVRLAEPVAGAPEGEKVRWRQYVQARAAIVGKLMNDLDVDIRDLIENEPIHMGQYLTDDLASIMARVKEACVGRGAPSRYANLVKSHTLKYEGHGKLSQYYGEFTRVNSELEEGKPTDPTLDVPTLQRKVAWYEDQLTASKNARFVMGIGRSSEFEPILQQEVWTKSVWPDHGVLYAQLVQAEQTSERLASTLGEKIEANYVEKKGRGDSEDSSRGKAVRGVCFSFKETGTCRFGDKCHFKHEETGKVPKEENGKEPWKKVTFSKPGRFEKSKDTGRVKKGFNKSKLVARAYLIQLVEYDSPAVNTEYAQEMAEQEGDEDDYVMIDEDTFISKRCVKLSKCGRRDTSLQDRHGRGIYHR
jgi:hypothetical protein